MHKLSTLYERLINAGRQAFRSGRFGARKDETIGADVITLNCDRPMPSISPRGFVMLVAAFLAFKGAVIAHLGLDTYLAAIRVLDQGALPEQAAAFIMRADFASLAIAQQLLPLLN